MFNNKLNLSGNTYFPMHNLALVVCFVVKGRYVASEKNLNMQNFSIYNMN